MDRSFLLQIPNIIKVGYFLSYYPEDIISLGIIHVCSK